MFKLILSTTIAWIAVPAFAAQRQFDFGQFNPGQTPEGFTSLVTGKGSPGEWKVIDVDVPPLLAPLSPGAKSTAKRPVLAQLSQDGTDEHFPVLLYTNEVYGEFSLTTRFKAVSG